MKKSYLLFLLLVLSNVFVFAQTFEITPFGGYVFPARWYSSNGSVYFYGDAQYGGIASLGLHPDVDLEFTYNRIDNKAMPEVYGYTVDDVPVSQNFYLIGAIKNFRLNETVCPFVGLNLGGVFFAPKESGYYSYWFFAAGLNGGVKVYFNKVLGFRFQAQLLMPVQGTGFYFYYGTGGGGSSVYLTSPLLEFGLNGGLIFRMGK